MARATGLEPATTGSTVRYSNQIELRPHGLPTRVPGIEGAGLYGGPTGPSSPSSTFHREGRAPGKTEIGRISYPRPCYPAGPSMSEFNPPANLSSSPGSRRIRIVFNADDLGVSTGNNTGIATACEAGLVREASLCVTGGAVEEGAEVARRLAGRVNLGLHLSFTLGKPLTGPLPGLCDDEGRFLPLKTVLRRCLFSCLDQERLREEIEAQIRAVQDLGFEISHINGHHHVHVYPQIAAALAEVLGRKPIPYLRLPLATQRKYFGLRGTFLGLLSRIFTARVDRGISLAPPLPLLGLGAFGRKDYRKIFEETARNLRPGTYEWMVHPRNPDPSFALMDHLDPSKEERCRFELETLCDPGTKVLLEELGIEVTDYRSIAAAS